MSSISSIMRPGEPGLCCVVTSALLGGRAVCDHLFLLVPGLPVAVLWVLPQLDGELLCLSWDGGHL